MWLCCATHSSQLGCQVAEPGPEVRGRWQKSSRKEMATSFKALERLKGRMYAFGFPKGMCPKVRYVAISKKMQKI